MILYNVTVSIDPSVAEDWLNWMRKVHIPEVMATGCFLESRLSRVHGEEEGGLTYSVLYLCSSDAVLSTYQKEFAPRLQQEHSMRYQGKFAAFRTNLTLIEEFKA